MEALPDGSIPRLKGIPRIFSTLSIPNQISLWIILIKVSLERAMLLLRYLDTWRYLFFDTFVISLFRVSLMRIGMIEE